MIAYFINSIIGSGIIGKCLIANFINSIIGSGIIGKCPSRSFTVSLGMSDGIPLLGSIESD